MWQGLTHITDFKGRTFANSSSSLSDELNLFYACFEALNTEPWTTMEVTPDEVGQVLTLNPTQVYKSLSRVNTRKAAMF